MKKILALRNAFKKQQDSFYKNDEKLLVGEYNKIAPYKKGEILNFNVESEGETYKEFKVRNGWIGGSLKGIYVECCAVKNSSVIVLLTIENDEKVRKAFKLFCKS